jgi:uncharacterized membrane protein YfcA
VNYALICIVAFFAAGLTFFSGFGLGTLLLPAFALFFPVEVAVALTAVVHLLNGLFKLVLVGRSADLRVALRFGLPALLAAYAGARLLVWLSDLPPLGSYELAGRRFAVMPIKFAVASLMALFAALELWPRFKKLAVPPRYLPAGGLLTGFFGGLSGHQGAFRSAFLLRAGLSKEAFIATGAVIATVIDVSRLSVYWAHLAAARFHEEAGLLIAATASAFIGSFLGNQLLEKVSLRAIEIIVAVMLFAIAGGLASGLL